MNDFLGVGWAFPIGVEQGRIAVARGDNDIEQAIRMILLTPKGQRVMRPEFGCQIHELLFAPNNSATSALAATYVEEALMMWEPRIQVRSVDVSVDPDHEGRLLVILDYEIKQTHDKRSLVFPFYRIPGE